MRIALIFLFLCMRILKTFLIIICFSFNTIGSIEVLAQNGGPALQISPVMFDHDLVPGDKILKEVSLLNNGNEEVSMVSEFADFIYDSKGEMKFIEESEYDNEESIKTSVKKWISTDIKEFTVAPGELKKIPFTITVPNDAEPGGHYGVLFFRSKPQGNGTIGVSARIGTLILVTVPGNVIKTGVLESFSVGTVNEKNEVISKTFFETKPINFGFRISNTGNVHFKPTGKIIIKDMFGKIVQEIPPSDMRVFPGIGRNFVVQSDIEPWGRYEAIIQLQDGDGHSMKEMTVVFWGFNYLLILQWVFLLLIIGFVFVIGVSTYYNRKVKVSIFKNNPYMGVKFWQ